MRRFFTRQGFDTSMQVIYGADSEGNLELLDQDLADKEMPRKRETGRDDVRSAPYTYLFWTKGSVANIVRRYARARDGLSEAQLQKFKKVVSIRFPLQLVFVSNKGNAVEDFEEAFAAEWQNLHNAPLSLKWAFPDESALAQSDMWMDATVIQELGSAELVSYREGNLFAYSWSADICLTVAGEFADIELLRLKSIVVDLYGRGGVPLASIGDANYPTHEPGTVPDTGTGEPGLGFVPVPGHEPKDPPETKTHTSVTGAEVPGVPVVPWFQKDYV